MRPRRLTVSTGLGGAQGRPPALISKASATRDRRIQTIVSEAEVGRR